ncbi:hypothetical protein AB0I82_04580 [Streptomyces sp. NPDC050315]|uniref:hypothetical protein n=1 Tax=Streptomyces sp. NPDC050315 TaxID=3155039 RepID=UPI0034225CEB
MDASVWVGAVFGLVGTVVGGGLSVWASVVAQRQQAAHARKERRRARTSTAIEAALTELFEVQRDARRAGPMDSARERQLHERVLNVRVLLQHVPDAALRSRVQEDTFLMPLDPPGDTRTKQERRADIMLLSADAIACLGAYLRGEPLPPRADRVTAVRALWPLPDFGSDADPVVIFEGDD